MPKAQDAQLTIEWWPIDRPLPYESNPRIHTEKSIAKIAKALKTFGWRQSLVVDDQDTIIVGHGRLLAAQKLGMEQVPVHVAKGLTKAQVKALRLADNRTQQESTWEYDRLNLELGELAALDFDLSTMGFDPDELAGLSLDGGFPGEKPIPEPPAEPVAKLGDVWLLGKHRLMCGDSTKAEDVRRLMKGERAPLMATDPPYLVDYEGGTHPDSEANGGIVDGVHVGHDEKKWDVYLDHAHAVGFYHDFLSVALREATMVDVAVYQCFGMMRTEVIWQAWREVGLLSHQVIIWKKTRTVLTYSWFLWDYEVVMVGWPQGHKPKTNPPATERAVWEIASTEGNEEGATHNHPTIKPVELMRRPIAWHTAKGGLVYDPFSGSGTTIIAAEQLGRRCYAMELAPEFVDVACQRYKNLTGEEPSVERDDG